MIRHRYPVIGSIAPKKVVLSWAFRRERHVATTPTVRTMARMATGFQRARLFGFSLIVRSLSPALALLKGEWRCDLLYRCDYLTTAFAPFVWSYTQIARSESRLHAANTKIRADTIIEMILLMLYPPSGSEARFSLDNALRSFCWLSPQFRPHRHNVIATPMPASIPCRPV